jgi:tRNA (cytidine/uridine-2'-O-)-methyltransferase
LTRYGDKIYTDITVKNKVEEIYLMFGSETSGLTPEIMKQHHQHLYRIPMSILARSLNVSNTVALVIYEILRQQQFSGLATKEVFKGEHFLKDKLNQ